jgi:hypothetical protein
MSGEVAMSGRIIARDESGAFLAAVEAGMGDAVQRAVLAGAGLARVYAPKRTGALAASVEGLVTGGTSGVIVATAGHALFQEEGTAGIPREGFFTDGPGGDFAASGPIGPTPATHFLRQAGQTVGSFFSQYLQEALP